MYISMYVATYLDLHTLQLFVKHGILIKLGQLENNLN